MDAAALGLAEFAPRIRLALVQFFPFLVAVIVHEFAHGFVAHRFGDTTARDAGRMTLNPAAHIDPIGTVLFPLINMLSGISLLIGWAKPVPIDPSRFSRYRIGLFLVSFAGPLSNFLLASLSAFAVAALIAYAPRDFVFFSPFLAMGYASVSLNFAIGFFNLLPLPPLDGSKMIQSLISRRLAERYERLTQFSFLILIALLMTGMLSFLATPIGFAARLALALASIALGVEPAQLGLELNRALGES